MARLNEEERAEFLRLAESASLREDMEYLASHRHNPVIVDGRPDLDRLVDFLNQFNECLNHMPRPFVPMREEKMRL